MSIAARSPDAVVIESDYAPIPRGDLPFGMPSWLGDNSRGRQSRPKRRNTVERDAADLLHTLIWQAPRDEQQRQPPPGSLPAGHHRRRRHRATCSQPCCRTRPPRAPRTRAGRSDHRRIRPGGRLRVLTLAGGTTFRHTRGTDRLSRRTPRRKPDPGVPGCQGLRGKSSDRSVRAGRHQDSPRVSRRCNPRRRIAGNTHWRPGDQSSYCNPCRTHIRPAHSGAAAGRHRLVTGKRRSWQGKRQDCAECGFRAADPLLATPEFRRRDL